MKNLFKREDQTLLVTGIAIGAVAGIALGYLFLTDDGTGYREQIFKKFKEIISDKAAKLIDEKTIIPKNVAKVAADAAIK